MTEDVSAPRGAGDVLLLFRVIFMNPALLKSPRIMTSALDSAFSHVEIMQYNLLRALCLLPCSRMQTMAMNTAQDPMGR